MKKTLLCLVVLCSCTYHPDFTNKITPQTKIEATYFHLILEDESEYWVAVFNFLEIGDMWLLWSKHKDEPQFMPILRIDHSLEWHTVPGSGFNIKNKFPIKDLVADWFYRAYNDSVKIRAITTTKGFGHE